MFRKHTTLPTTMEYRTYKVARTSLLDNERTCSEETFTTETTKMRMAFQDSKYKSGLKNNTISNTK